VIGRRARTVALAAILLLAAALRFSGLSWGLRHPPHSDEQDFVTRVVAMVKAGDLDHRWYQYPGLFLYLLGAAVAPLGPSRWDGPDAYLAARSVVAAFGVFNVGLIYVAGSRRVGPSGALAAALLLAVSPLDIQTSHQVRADIVLQTAGILALIVWPRIGQDSRGDLRAGLVVGFATAVKFTGLLLVPSYVAARLLAPGRRFRGMLVAGLVTIAVVLACTPYAVIHWRQYLGIGMEGASAYNSVSGGPATYYRGESHPLRTLLYMVQGAVVTLGPLGSGLFLVGAVMRLRESWRDWVPSLLHPITTLLVVAPTGMMFQRHILPAMGIAYLLAATPVELLWRRSRVLAVALAIAAAAIPLRRSAGYVEAVSTPSAEDRVLDWINASMAPGSRILETRPGSRVGATPGMALGIDSKRFEFIELRADEDRAALSRLAPEMDLVVVGPGKGGTWRSGLRTVYQGAGPFGVVAVQLQVPAPGSRPAYVPVPLSRARLSASENADAVALLADGDPRTTWTSRGAMAGHEWLEVALEHPARLGRIELLLGNVPQGYGPDLQLRISEDGRAFEDLRVVEVRARPSRQNPAWRPVSQVLVFEPRTARHVRILQTGVRAEPWAVSELRLETAEGPARAASVP